jgi:hypothetical protein
LRLQNPARAGVCSRLSCPSMIRIWYPMTGAHSDAQQETTSSRRLCNPLRRLLLKWLTLLLTNIPPLGSHSTTCVALIHALRGSYSSSRHGRQPRQSRERFSESFHSFRHDTKQIHPLCLAQVSSDPPKPIQMPCAVAPPSSILKLTHAVLHLGFWSKHQKHDSLVIQASGVQRGSLGT